jgi:hypothetical protein
MVNSHSTLEQLQHEYKEAYLIPKHKELVTDQEINEFLLKRENFWATLFWIVFIASILLAGGISK